MSESQLRARSISEIVDGAMVLYRKDAGSYMLATALGLAPVVALQLMFPGTEALINEDAPDMAAIGAALGQSLLLGVVAMISYAAIGGVIIVMGSRAYLGETPDIREALRVTLPRVFALIGATILKSFIYGLGFLLLIVGFFYFAARFFAVEPALMLEGKGVGDSFGRSSVLAKERTWHILGVMVLVGIVYLILFACAGVAAAMVDSRVLQLVFSNLATVIALPAWQLAMVVLYYDARIRSEGFDLEHMAASLDSPAPAR